MCTRFLNCGRRLAAMAIVAVLIGGGAVAQAQSGGPHEGIKVIGEWSIVVRDESGRVVQRSDFRNALIATQGPGTLASLLSRQRPIGEWLILLANGGPGGQPCGTATVADKSCGLMERVSSQLPFGSSVDYATGLTVSLDPADSTKVRLQGSRRASASGTITTVSTMLGRCPAGAPSPTGCTETQAFFYFSGTANFANPPSVVEGQTVDVTVTFSFQ